MISSDKIILGIDPGYADTGYGLIQQSGSTIKFIDAGSISTPKENDFGARLQFIFKSVDAIIKKHHPDLIAVEKLYFSKNVKTALDVGQARGVVLLAIHQSRANLLELTPNQVKQALTSTGNAGKHQVGQMVKTILSLPSVPKPDDAADALAIAIAASFINPRLISK